jgi:hypothetical protein
MEPPQINETKTFEKQVCGFEDEFSLSAGSCCDDGGASPAPKPSVNVS